MGTPNKTSSLFVLNGLDVYPSLYGSLPLMSNRIILLAVGSHLTYQFVNFLTFMAEFLLAGFPLYSELTALAMRTVVCKSKKIKSFGFRFTASCSNAINTKTTNYNTIKLTELHIAKSSLIFSMILHCPFITYFDNFPIDEKHQPHLQLLLSHQK